MRYPDRMMLVMMSAIRTYFKTTYHAILVLYMDSLLRYSGR